MVTPGEPADCIFLMGAAAALPDRSLAVDAVLQLERERYRSQLSAVSARLRQRLGDALGIEAVGVHDRPASELAQRAATAALETAALRASRVRLLIDFSTLPGDEPGLWSLAIKLQAELGCEAATALSVLGGGCAGLQLGLRTACALMRAEPELDTALLVASDCVKSAGRVCLPVSILGDAASALVLRRAPAGTVTAPRILGTATSTLGTYQDVIGLRGSPPQLEIDGRRFESQILPLHFVMCQRVLGRALRAANRSAETVTGLVYPNTSALDREQVLRALPLPQARLYGPGPAQLGHTLGNDMIVNLPPLWTADGPGPDETTALIAVGSGFTWGASIIGH